MSMNLTLDNPYKEVNIPRAKLRVPEDGIVIANPMVTEGYNPYANQDPPGENKEGTTEPPPYTIKEDPEEQGRCRTCCYRCRRK